jgi:proline racemase
MPWVQESIIGSRFTAAYTWHDRSQGIILPTLQGTAFVTAAATLSMNPADPFYHGIPPH